MSITSARTIFTQTGRHATQSDEMKESGKRLEQERQVQRRLNRVRERERET